MVKLVALVPFMVCVLGVVTHAVADPARGDWPCWRGADGTGISDENGWSATGTTRWRRNVGLGYSSPVISNGLLIVQGFQEDGGDDEDATAAETDGEGNAAPGDGQDTLYALDVETGDVVWSVTYPGNARAIYHGGGTLTTPTIAGNRVYVATRSGVLRCLSVADGSLIWMRSLMEDHELRVGGHGASGSPVSDGDLVVLSIGGTTLAVAAEDGADRWKGPTYPGGFSTATRFQLDGRDAWASFTGMGLAVIAADTGEELSTFEWYPKAGGACCAAPVVVGDRLFISAGYNLGGAMVEFEGGEAKAAWTTRRMRNKVNPCVLYDGHLYGFDESMLKCMDLEGAEQWRIRGLGMGSVSVAGGRLLVLSSEGELLIAPATPAGFEPESRQQVLEGGVYWTPPVLANGRIYCRSSLGDLVCLDHGVAPETQTSPQPGVGEMPAAETLFARHLEAIGGEAAVREHTSVHMKGSIEVLSAGSTRSVVEIDRKAPDRSRFAYLFPGFGWVEECHDGEHAWVVHPWKESGLFEGDLLREWQDKSAFLEDCEPASVYAEMKTTGFETFAGKRCFVVTATTHRGAKRFLYFDMATRLLVGRDGPTEAMEEYDDYRDFGGLKIATSRRILEPDTGEERKFTIDEVTFDSVEDDRFAMPPKIAWLMLAPEEAASRDAAAAEQHASLLGRYQAETGVVEIKIHQAKLALGFGTSVMDLGEPDETGYRALSETDGIRFQVGEDGVATAIVLVAEGAPDVVYTRLEEGSDEDS